MCSTNVYLPRSLLSTLTALCPQVQLFQLHPDPELKEIHSEKIKLTELFVK